MLVNITSGAWSDPITLTSAEVWECRGGTIYITTDASEDPLGGISLQSGERAEFKSGQAGLRWRAAVPGTPTQLARIAVS